MDDPASNGRPMALDPTAVGPSRSVGPRFLGVPLLLIAGVLVNLALVFLPSYDSNNFTFVLTEVGGFGPNAPALASSGWPGGFFTLAVFLPAYLGFVASGFSVYWAAVAAKAIFLALTVGTAVLLREIGRQRSEAMGDLLAAFVLLNPALLYVNYVWANWDAFPVFFTLLAYYLLRFAPPWSNETARVVAAVGALAVASFFYWYPILLLPTLLLYARSRSERRVLIVASVAVLGTLLAVNFLGFVGVGFPYLQDFTGGGAGLNRVHWVGLQYFIALGGIGSALLGLLSVLAVPIWLHRQRVAEAGTAAVVLLLFVWTSPVPLPDSFVWVLWFCPLYLLAAPGSRVTWSKLLGASALPIYAVIGFSAILTNDQADGQGLFYFGYPLLQSNVRIFPTTDELSAYVLAFNLVLAALLAFSIYRIWGGRASSRWPMESPDGQRPRVGSTGDPVLPARRPAARPSVGTVAMILAVAALVGIGGLAYNANAPSWLNHTGNGPLPLPALHPTFVPYDGNAPRPTPSSTYASDGPTVEIFPSARPIAFGDRPLGRSLSVGLHVGLSGSVPTVTPLAGGAPYNVTLITLPTVNAFGATRLSPSVSESVSPSHIDFPLMNAGDATTRLNRSSILTYAINGTSLAADYYYLSFQYHRNGTPVPIFELRTSVGDFDLLSFPGLDFLNFTAPGPTSPPVSFLLSGIEVPGNWNYVVFHASAPAFWFDLNGLAVTLPFPTASGNANLSIGRAMERAPNVPGLVGSVSELLAAPHTPTPFRSWFLNVTDVSHSLAPEIVSIASPIVDLGWSSDASGTRLQADGYYFSSPARTSLLYFGKLITGAYDVSVTIDEWVTAPDAPSGPFLFAVYAATVTPYLFLGALALRLRAERRSDPAAQAASATSA